MHLRKKICVCIHFLTFFSSSHVLLQLQLLLAQLQYTVLYGVLTNQLYHLYSPDTQQRYTVSHYSKSTCRAVEL